MPDCSVIMTVDQHVVSAKIDDCLRTLDCPRENALLFITHAASYMRASSAENLLSQTIARDLPRTYVAQLR